MVEYCLGKCICAECYTSRGLVMPECPRCQHEDEVREALLLSYEFGKLDDPEISEEVVETNRESLTWLRDKVQEWTKESPTPKT